MLLPQQNRPAQNRPTYNRPAFNRPAYNRPAYNRPAYNRPAYNRPAFSVVDKTQAGPLMVPAYRNVRATGGAVASSPYRGRPWRGWMLLCYFLRAEESKKLPLLMKKGLGLMEKPRVYPRKKKGLMVPLQAFACKKGIMSESELPDIIPFGSFLKRTINLG